MARTLNITNGDCAINVMRQANIPGEYLAWSDVLHEGPVTQGLSLSELSKVRMDFIAGKGWAPREQVEKTFVERDNTLMSYAQYGEVILWFEHDLYDQLQLLQILDWFNHQSPLNTELSLICVDEYLGPMVPEELAALMRYKTPISQSQLALATEAWNAFCSDTPEPWYALLQADTSSLPFLHGAVLRLLGEYPSTFNGLSRTANTALSIINSGHQKPYDIFSEYQESEERRFLGDIVFWGILKNLSESNPPAISREGKNARIYPPSENLNIHITSTGKELLKGQKKWSEIGKIDQFLGGVHLTSEKLWCWDRNSKEIQRIK